VPDNKLPFGPAPGDVFVSDDDAERVDFVVCVFPREAAWPYVATMLYGVCSKCRAVVVFQPHVPRRPPKLCRPCAGKLIGDQEIIRAWTNRVAGN